LILGLDSPERTLELVQTARKHFPKLTILARAFDWNDSFDLLDAGVPHVYRDTLDTALRTGTDALQLLGFRAHQAHRAAQKSEARRGIDAPSLRAARPSPVHRAGATDRRLRADVVADLEEPSMTGTWLIRPLVEEYKNTVSG
jgi:voltage-gated potassium channel Kch